MQVTFENRKLDIRFDNVSYDPDYWCDMFINHAIWEDNDTELTDEEYDRMNNSIDKDTWIMEYLY